MMMNSIESLMAVISGLAYVCDDINPVGKSKKEFLAESRRLLNKYHKENAKEFPSLNLERFKIFHVDDDMVSLVNYSDKIAIVAYRGTTQTDTEDLANDLHISIGLTPNRTLECIEFFNNLIKSLKKKGDYIYYATGHSLGGYFAEKIIYQFNETHPKLKLAGMSFNAGSGPFSRFEGFLN